MALQHAADKRPSFTLLAVVSADGFIARQAADNPADWASAEEQARFLAEVPGYDWGFLGRTTHELAFRLDRRRVVFSRQARGLDWREARHLWLDPSRHRLADILAELATVHPPERCVVLGGTAVHDWFIERGLVGRIELSIEPVRFGTGLPLLTGQPPGDATAALAARGFLIVDRQQLNATGTRLLTLVRPGPG